SRKEMAFVAATTSLSFDISVFELFGTWVMGGCVVLLENALALGGENRVTLINTVPSLMAEVLRHQRLPNTVVTVTLAGEALSPSLVDRLHALGVRRVWNLYGPTETTVFATAHLCD